MDRISENNIKFNSIIGEGSEAIIYDVEVNQAYKRFMFHTMRETLKNKQNKIELINKTPIEGFVKPNDIVFDIQGFRGYTMEKLLSNTTVLDVILDEEKSLKEKIELLKKIETLIKNAHKNDVLLIDLNFKNFVVVNNDVKGVDIDNFMIGRYEADCLPSATYNYYLNVVSKDINENMDKFAFAIHSLVLLSNEPITNWHLYKGKYEKIDELLARLDVSNNFKEYYNELLKGNNKLFLSEVIDEISSSDSFIKKK